MQVLSLLSAAALAFTAVTADSYTINQETVLYGLGDLATTLDDRKKPVTAETLDGDCNGVPEGAYACGNNSSVGNVIYQCDGSKLKKVEQCFWATGTGGQCTKNSRTGTGRYYILVSNNKGVCVNNKFTS
jgi:hypothetical protein